MSSPFHLYLFIVSSKISYFLDILKRADFQQNLKEFYQFKKLFLNNLRINIKVCCKSDNFGWLITCRQT